MNKTGSEKSYDTVSLTEMTLPLSFRLQFLCFCILTQALTPLFCIPTPDRAGCAF
jgi:hypothetical protein